ncbi:Craniofacial development protein 2 [Stylophora pistillata]|uniref:Craniofacial development protein 2 n=1 Tax=Stylophora pistillata TaxID=50429 RepID=A0A2B4RDV4_STYPI|nr:Craniofacial development protein 2 [Stylophora pistillata]
MSIRFRLSKRNYATIISAYAPIMTYPDEIKEEFYEILSRTIRSFPPKDELILLADFNARVGRDHDIWGKVLGHHGVGKTNSNGMLLLGLCAANELVITNTIFQQKDSLKATCMHPRSQHWHLLDYATIRQRDLADIHLTRSVRSSTAWSDHRLVRVKSSLRLLAKIHHKSRLKTPRLDVRRLKADEKCALLRKNIKAEVEGMAAEHEEAMDVERLWNVVREDWLSDKLNQAKKENYQNVQSAAQAKIRRMKDKWWKEKARLMQSAANKNDMRTFYKKLKAIHGPCFKGMPAVRSSDGRIILNDPTRIKERWAEHFEQLLNRPFHIANAVLDDLPSRPTLECLSLPITLDEVTNAISVLKNGKASGCDSIPPEVFNKDERADCNNHRGISLLCIAGKILARIIVRRATALAEEVNPESQYGYRENGSTVDMLFEARKVQAKCREQKRDLYIIFVDLTKAFDSVSRTGLWMLLHRVGFTEKVTNTIRSFHDGLQARVVDGGLESAPFDVGNGVKQGCVFAPLLFSIVVAAVIYDAFHNCENGINSMCGTIEEYSTFDDLRQRPKSTIYWSESYSTLMTALLLLIPKKMFKFLLTALVVPQRDMAFRSP